VVSGDTVEIKANNNSRQIATRALEENRARVVPGWLTRNDEALTAVVNRLPTRDEMDPSVNEQLIVEFYSRF
jgi:small subunit ribosomal protein S4